MSYSYLDYQHTFSWKIKDFSWCVEKCGEYLSSPEFDAPFLGRSKWKLTIYPRSLRHDRKNYVSVYLVNVDLDMEKLYVETKIELIGSNQKILKFEKYKYLFEKGSRLSWKNFIKREIFHESRGSSSLDILTIVLHMKKVGQESISVIEHKAYTENHVDQFSFIWNVRNPNCIEFTESKKVNIPEGSIFRINLRCPENDILIQISKLSNFPSTKVVEIKISLLNVKGIEIRSKTDSYFFGPKENVWQFPPFITKTCLLNEEKDFFCNGMFALFFKIYISHGKVSDTLSEVKQYALPTKNDSCVSSTLRDDFRKLFNSQKHSDLKIKCGKSVFFAHKLILTARSRVFSAMFDQSVIKNKEEIINIEDLDENTFKFFLKFMYTDSLDEIDYESASKLLIAADKYKVVPLMERCSDYLIQFMSLENVCETLIIADIVFNKNLKLYAFDYIKKHSSEILKSSKWAFWIKHNIELGAEVLHHITITHR